MNLTRRCFMKSAMLAASAAAAPAGAAAPPPAAMIVYDSRLPQSRALLGRRAHCALDVAQEHANLWRTLRGAAPRGRVVGMTTWSDLVLARGLLEEKGLRLRAEARRGALFYWEMS